MTRRTTIALILLSLTALLAVAPTVQAASLSELLEQGVYAEDTKGDLDAALKAYQQVVADAKADEALAAQAQYRLGVVYHKKREFSRANEAFEKLIKDYPDQKEFVSRASEYLAGASTLLPAPWVDGEVLHLDVKLGSGFKIGTARYTADADEMEGRKIWRLSSYLYAGVQQLSRVEVEADSFKPIHCRWKHTLLGDSDTTYASGKAEVRMLGKDEVNTVDLEGIIYDNEECLALFRRLPLASNYSTTITVFAGLTGGHLVPFKLEVSKVENVTVPAGTFECYRVDLSIKQSFWYSTDESRYLVKFEAGGVVAELAEILRHNPQDPVLFQDSVVSVTAPPGWLFFAQKPMDGDGPGRLLILDPDAVAETSLSTRSLTEMKPEEKSSLRAVADSAVAEATRKLKDFQVRPDSWKETTLAGHPALSVMADYRDGDDPHVAHAVFTMAGGRAVEVHTHTDTRDFDSFRLKFEAILKTVKLN